MTEKEQKKQVEAISKKLNLQKGGKETPEEIEKETLEKVDSRSFSVGKEVLAKEYS